MSDSEKRLEEIKKELKTYRAFLKKPGISIANQTWVGVAIKDLKAEMKSIKLSQSLTHQ